MIYINFIHQKTTQIDLIITDTFILAKRGKLLSKIEHYGSCAIYESVKLK